MDINKKSKTFCFDIDGVIMKLVPNNDYNISEPIMDTVNLINSLYENGHYIIVFTARGYITKIDWNDITRSQLQHAGLKYHELKFGKPAADYYIDDKFIDLKDLSTKIKNNEI